ncbi:MAG: anthranilate phosphoribosyltransferase [Flavobacteriaceae bacterium]|nr:MAG: anthranilate phosphoribosyltransferase [Flavobacteriaceae bacterium]
MKNILNKLFAHEHLNAEEAKDVLIRIAKNEFNTSQIASFLTVFLMRSLSVNELIGFRDALLELAIRIDFSDFNTIDLCGTGGDGKDTFNISTLTSFIVAGAGYKVAKHGNYGVSSTCGSSNMLEYLGYQFSNDEAVLKRQLDTANICFLHAPLFHPAMKTVGPIRRELGLKTFFNVLGPLVNPSQPKNQMVGVFNMEIARLYGYLMQQSSGNYKVVHSFDGYDEISLTSKFNIISNKGTQIFTPEEINFKRLAQSDIVGGDSVASSVKIFKDIIQGKGTEAQNNVVLANTAFAIQTIAPETNFEEAFEQSKDSLLGLKGAECLTNLLA